MNLHNPFDDGEPHTGAFRLRIELVEEAEDVFVVTGIDSDAVVADEEQRVDAAVFDTDLDAGRRIGCCVLGGVIDEVLEDLDDPLPVAVDEREVGRRLSPCIRPGRSVRLHFPELLR